MSEIGSKFKLYLLSDRFNENERNIRQTNDEVRTFVKKFSKTKILNMELDEYVQGKGKNDSFTYYIERKFDSLGRILGGSVSKFGVWYSEEEKKYKHTKKYGKNVNQAFDNVKKAIVDVIKAGENSDLEALHNSPLSEMFKSKIFYLYFPKKALPIYSPDHINAIMTMLRIDNHDNNQNTFVKRQMIIDYKDRNIELKDEKGNQINNLVFMQFIYSADGFEHEFRELKEIDTGLEAVMIDATGINYKEVSAASKSPRKWKRDPKVQAQQTAVGVRGEEIVLNYEKKTRPKFRDRIKWESKKNDTLGYDILSFDDFGNEKYIEVKTKTDGSVNNIEFHLSRNQLHKLMMEENHVIYYVFGLNLKVKKIIEITKEMIVVSKLVPEMYLVKASAILR